MTTTRRVFLGMLLGAPLAAGGPAHARKDARRKDGRIGRLIQEARVYPEISRRIEFISRALLGIPYQAGTLIGGPRQQELFVVRDDAFDCVTYCEVVLAAALAKGLAEFDAVLRRIRYEHGEVRWDRRNHYFAEWSRRIVENRICRPVAMTPSVPIEKTVDWDNQGRRRVSITGIPAATLLANRKLLHSGDVIGFVSRQPKLDFFHTGFVAHGKEGSLMLRHASQSRGRVVEEKMDVFLAVNGPKYVTLLRAENSAPAVT